MLLLFFHSEFEKEILVQFPLDPSHVSIPLTLELKCYAQCLEFAVGVVKDLNL
jgi:hypothetical protein